MKRLLTCALVLMIAIMFIVPTGLADYNWYGSSIATVISTTVSIRESPDEQSNRLYRAANMDELVVVGDYYDWYIVDCYLSGLSATEQTGYVYKRFVSVEGYQITLSGNSLDVYTDPWSGKCNGQKAQSGEVLYVIYETDQWLVCQLKTQERTPGSCFIKKSDLGLNISYNSYDNDYITGYITAGGQSEYGTHWSVMYDSDGVSVGIRVQPDLDTEMLAIIHSGDVVTVLQNDGEFAYVLYVKPNGQEVRGWVRTKYFLPAD